MNARCRAAVLLATLIAATALSACNLRLEPVQANFSSATRNPGSER